MNTHQYLQCKDYSVKHMDFDWMTMMVGEGGWWEDLLLTTSLPLDYGWWVGRGERKEYISVWCKIRPFL